MVGSCLLFDDFYPESLCHFKVYGFESFGNITHKNLFAVLRASDIVELNAIY